MLGESSFPSSSMSAFTENKGYNLDMTIFSTTRGLALPAHLMVNLDDFRCDELIASGGGADVYKGEALRANLSDISRIIVVKKPKITNDFGMRMFEQEVCIMSLLGRSKYVAKLVGYSAEPPCMLLQMYEFGSVYSFTKKQKLTRKWKVRFSLDISKGISDIHCSHIAHCDIKPQNILVERDRKKWRCVITDFGIAQVLSQDLMIVKSMQYVSTRGLSVQYAAPEIFIRFRRMMNDGARVMKAGDVYSFGIVLYFLITRKQPWYYS
jgi:serine/threonine protein kinase